MKAFIIISYWKKACLSVFVSCGIMVSALAQCTSFHSITFDTTMVGTGNSSHLFSLAQFNPSIGTLVSAHIKSVVSVNYGFTLKNTESVQRNFMVSVERNDEIHSTAMTGNYVNSIDTSIGTFVLDPGASVSKSPYTVIYRYINSDSITANTANFLGNGLIEYNYMPQTYTNLVGSNSYLYSASANDTIHFSITYYYCDQMVLAPSIFKFDARKADDEKISLTWNTSNEQSGRLYQVEKGMDQFDFTTIDAGFQSKQTTMADYSYEYATKNFENGKLFFRLKITAADASVSYSEIKMVDMTHSRQGVQLYPNPSNEFINIIFNQVGLKHWRADILSVNGSLIQSNQLSNTNTAHIEFRNRMASGVYFLRVTDEDSHKNQLLSFLVK